MNPQEQHILDEYQRRLDAASATYDRERRDAAAWYVEAAKALREGREVPNCRCNEARHAKS